MGEMGFKVTIELAGKAFPPVEVLRNVTEIHYGCRAGEIAFESDIHHTGLVHYLDNIKDFEAVPETEIASAF